MSAVKVMRISFSANNPFGTFVAGDYIDVYYDTTLDTSPGSNRLNGLTVFKNGIQITSGNTIDYSVQSYKTVQFFNYRFCNSGALVVFSPVNSSFPYGYNQYFQNYTACAAVPIVCDLYFSPHITLSKPSSPSTNDGSITVVAVSSYPIKYSLSDFDYTDGTGQSSGVFANLYPGSYRIFARDSQNCGTQILINLTYEITYSVKYTIDYINIAGHRTKIDILKKNYSGPTIDLILGESPFILEMRGEGNLDKFQSVISTQSTIQLISQTDGQFLELYTNDPRQYKINYYKDTTGGTSYSLHWTGFIVPQIYSESYISTPYPVSVQSTDGLSTLSDISFLQDDGNNFFGSIRIMSLLSIILKKTNLELNIRCGINMFATSMAQTGSDDPLDQAYVDVDTYYLGFSNPSFADVLKTIITTFRARLIQSNGVWNIFRPEEMGNSFAYREFDSDGNYLSNSTYNPVVQVKAATSNNRMRWKDQDQNLELRPGFGKLRVNYKLGYKKNILRNGDFSLISSWDTVQQNYNFVINLYGFQVISPFYPIISSYQFNTPGNLNDVSILLSAANVIEPLGYIQSDNYSFAMGVSNQLKFSLTVKAPKPLGYFNAVDGSGNLVSISYAISIPYQRVRANVKYGNKYLQNDGTWTNIPTDLVFYLTQWDQFVTFDVTANQPDTSYSTENTFVVKVYHSWENDYDFTNTTDFKKKITNSNTGTYSNRGNYNASSGVFPLTGGSGGGGSIIASDRWTVNVAGTIAGIFCAVGTKLTAIIDAPGQNTAYWLIGDLILSSGARVVMFNLSFFTIDGLLYYELQNDTSAESFPDIVRPNDYNATTNPYQWILIDHRPLSTRPFFDFYIDKIQIEYLDNGSSPYDTIIQEVSGETNNTLAVEQDIYHGSLETLINTINTVSFVPNVVPDKNNIFKISGQFPNNKTVASNAVYSTIKQNILAGNLIYTGWLRDSLGVGYTTWARSNVVESSELHVIWLKTTIAQYNRSWKKLTGSMYADIFCTFVNTVKDLDNTIYLPMSLSIDDKNNFYNGEFLELIDITQGSGSDGTNTSAFSSGFSNGFR